MIGSFIVDYLEKNGYTHIRNSSEKANKTFETLITNTGVWYSITVYFKVYKNSKKDLKVTFYDSLKILPFTVSKIAKDFFDIVEQKLELDYNKIRPKNHKLTKAEIEYIKNDVIIISKALDILFKEKLTGMTQASNSLMDYKNIITRKKFDHYFPNIDCLFEEIKPAYKGGFTYLSPEYIEKDVENITVLDVNSLYPLCYAF